MEKSEKKSKFDIDLTIKYMKKHLEKMKSIMESKYDVNGRKFSLEDNNFVDFLHNKNFHGSDTRFNNSFDNAVEHNLEGHEKIKKLHSDYENFISRICNMKTPENYREIFSRVLGVNGYYGGNGNLNNYFENPDDDLE